MNKVNYEAAEDHAESFLRGVPTCAADTETICRAFLALLAHHRACIGRWKVYDSSGDRIWNNARRACADELEKLP